MLTSSVGLFTAIVTWLALKAWPAQLVSGAVPAAASLMVCGAGAALVWRARSRAVGARWPSGGSAFATNDMAVQGGVTAAVELPAGFERDQLLGDLRGHFVRLQAAWDAGEVGALRALVTAQMLEQLCEAWPACGASAERTDVVTLHAELLGFETLSCDYLVTVEFSGLIRESAQHGAAPFRELWMMARSKQDAGGWKLARQQALL